MFFIWKFVDLVVSLLSPHFIPYSGFFSYGKTMFQYGMPDFVRALTNFDGIFYIRIALNGYSTTEQAYFPLYPLTIRFVNSFLHNPIISGVLISHVAFILGLLVFHRYLSLHVKEKVKKWVVLFLFAYPTSYYFGVMYTESLFFLLCISSLYFFERKKYFPAFVAGYFAATTRVIGVFLFIPLAVYLWGLLRKRKSSEWKRTILQNIPVLFVLIAPLLGLGTYCLYLWQTTGDPLYFFHAQEHFGAQRSTKLVFPPQVIYRYVKIFITADKNFQYFVAALEISFYLSVLGILMYDLRNILRKKKLDLHRLGLNMFSIVNILIPSFTGTLTAIPRYSLFSFSLFFVLGEIENKWVKVFFLTVFAILHIIMLAFFIQGYYVT